MRYRILVTVPFTAVNSNLVDFPVYVDLSTLPLIFWSQLVYDSGADIRVEDTNNNLIPFDIVYISRVSKTGCLFVKISVSAESDTLFYIYYGDSSLSLLPFTDSNGRNAVWSGYHRVLFFGDYLFDRTGSGERLNFTNLYNYSLKQTEISPDTTCHQGCSFDGTYYYTIGTNLLRKYDTSWNIVEENTDPCGDAGGPVNHCGSGFVRDGVLYTAQTYTSYANTRLSEYRTSDLSFIRTRSMSALGGVYWTAGVCYVPEWNQFVFCEYNNDGTKLFVHNNDESLSYEGSITLSTALLQMQGITYWRGAFWIGSDSDDYIYRSNSDGTEVTIMGYVTDYVGMGGLSNYGDDLYLIRYQSSSPEHGIIFRVSLPDTVDNIGPGLLLEDTSVPDHRATISTSRFTQWSIGIGQKLTYRKGYQNHVIGYGLLSSADNAKRESVTWTNAEDRFNVYNSSDGLLRRDPLTTTPACSFKDAFADGTIGNAPSGWTERWNTTAADITIQNEGYFGIKCIDLTSTSSSRYAASIDSLGTSVTNVEILSLSLITDSINHACRVLIRGSGSIGSESCYFAYINVLDNAIGIHLYSAGSSVSVQSAAKTLSSNTWYYMRFRAVDDALKLKVWERGTVEPVSWDIEVTNSVLSSGWVGIGRASAATNSVYYDYIAVNVSSSPATVPLPVTDTGIYARVHVVHDGTTERKLYYNNTVYTDTSCAERPSADANGLMVGYNDADYQYGTDGHLTFLYLINSILSPDWITAENNNISSPSTFYLLGDVEYISSVVLVGGSFRAIEETYINTGTAFRTVIGRYINTSEGWKQII